MRAWRLCEMPLRAHRARLEVSFGKRRGLIPNLRGAFASPEGSSGVRERYAFVLSFPSGNIRPYVIRCCQSNGQSLGSRNSRGLSLLSSRTPVYRSARTQSSRIEFVRVCEPYGLVSSFPPGNIGVRREYGAAVSPHVALWRVSFLCVLCGSARDAFATLRRAFGTDGSEEGCAEVAVATIG